MRLVGVGMGPGDPELVTVKAVRVLREADAVVVPVMAGAAEGTGRAEATVLAHASADRVTRVPFALDDRGGLTARREQAWNAAADTLIGLFDAGAHQIAYATIGDPNLYSTFHYLAQTVQARRPDVAVETVPGITALQDLAARSGTVLAEGREPLTLVPLTGDLATLESALAGPGTVVVYKGWRRMDAVVTALHSSGRLADAVVGAGLGLPGEYVGPACGAPTPLPYLSTVIAPPARAGRGGKL